MKNLEQITESPTRYLWAANLNRQLFGQGSLIVDRYAVQLSQVVVDTQPYNLPEVPDDFSEEVIGYLRLARLSLHLPRPYGLLTPNNLTKLPPGTEILLLDNVPLDENGNLLPSFNEQWSDQPPLRQINWLWQILHLWRPLEEQGFSQSLFSTDYLRVDGAWVRLLQLTANQEPTPFTQLGDLWLGWLDGVHPSIHDSIAELFYGMARGSYNPEAAIAHLDRLATTVTKDRPLTIRIATATDPGRRRDYNEDSCYPKPSQDTLLIDNSQTDNLQNCVAIVCDGLGGHEGGEVASRMAINSLCSQLEPFLRKIETGELVYSAKEFMRQLEAIVRIANDSIVLMNDQQQRIAQRRMGTTLVMAVIPRPMGQPTHEVYLVHVGDSRIYWVSPSSCHQVTLDDDVATRETIMGLNFYAYSSQRVDGGALIQALGTRSSDVLLPRVQRLILDEECLLLLCSDGLSDYERIPEIFSSHIRPVLTDRLSLTASCQNLINQGNFLNGHDNITVALIRCQTAPYSEVDVAIQPKLARSRKFASPETKLETSSQQNLPTSPSPVPNTLIQPIAASSNTSIPTQVVPKRRKSEKSNSFLLFFVVFIISFGAMALVLANLPLLQGLFQGLPTNNPAPPPPRDRLPEEVTSPQPPLMTPREIPREIPLATPLPIPQATPRATPLNRNRQPQPN